MATTYALLVRNSCRYTVTKYLVSVWLFHKYFVKYKHFAKYDEKEGEFYR